jgi:hypothetical protein
LEHSQEIVASLSQPFGFDDHDALHILRDYH